MSHGNPAIDTDPQVLRMRAETALHAADETWAHLAAEIAAADGDYDKLMSTLRPDGPYAYAIQPQIHGDGTVRVPRSHLVKTSAQPTKSYVEEAMSPAMKR